MSASVGVRKEAKTKANVGSISFHETRQQCLLPDRSRGRGTPSNRPILLLLTHQIIRLSCYREASSTIIAKPPLRRKSLSCLSEPGGPPLRRGSGMIQSCSCRLNFPQRFINLIVRSIPAELLQGKFLLGYSAAGTEQSSIFLFCLFRR